MATDYAINGWLEADKVGVMPKVGLYKKEYVGLSAEVIYNDLVKKQESVQNPMDQHLPATGADDGDSEAKGQRVPLTAKELSELRNAIITAKQMHEQSKGAGNLAAGLELLIEGILESKISWKQYLEKMFSESVRANYTYSRYN